AEARSLAPKGRVAIVADSGMSGERNLARIDALGADDGVDRVTAQAVDQLRALVADLALLEASVAAESDPHRRATLEAAAARSGDQLDGLLGSLRTLHAELAVRAADGGVAADVGDLVQRVAATSEVDAAARRVREAAHRASGRTAQ
ncbi:MAG: hypothetical protein ABMB14_26720, partial [Myxococcota bacterium]